MPVAQVPNIKVWSVAQQYADAAIVLLDSNKLLPAAVLASLATEILLKSFNATYDHRGRAKPISGHELTKLFGKLSDADRVNLINALADINPETDLLSRLTKFDSLFTKARYFYEPNALFGIDMDIRELMLNEAPIEDDVLKTGYF